MFDFTRLSRQTHLNVFRFEAPEYSQMHRGVGKMAGVMEG
jgi:hypothetical protein